MSIPEEAAPAHPEEMKADFEMRVGKHVTLQGSARITPAGVICTGLAVAAILVSTGFLVAAVKRRRF